MSVSCVGTCSACGVRRFWLSGTLALQLDDGSLKCLPHPGEAGVCEAQYGLTLAQASERGRLYRETFYVCRHCGRDGEIIEQRPPFKDTPIDAFTIRGSVKFSVALLLLGLPITVWFRWWQAATFVTMMAVVFPLVSWRANRKFAAQLAARGLPRKDAPGRVAAPKPTRGCDADSVVGQRVGGTDVDPDATGPCCQEPTWIPAFKVTDEDRVPCCACARGVMTVSEHSVH